MDTRTILNITKYWLISTMNSIFTFPHLDIRVAKVGVASTNYVAQKNLHVQKEALYHHCWFMLFFDYFFYNNEFDVFMHETNFLCFLHKIWNPVKYSTWAQVDICFNARCWFDLFIHDTIHKVWCNHNSYTMMPLKVRSRKKYEIYKLSFENRIAVDC